MSENTLSDTPTYDCYLPASDTVWTIENTPRCVADAIAYALEDIQDLYLDNEYLPHVDYVIVEYPSTWAQLEFGIPSDQGEEVHSDQSLKLS